MRSDFVMNLLNSHLPRADIAASRAEVLHPRQRQLPQISVLHPAGHKRHGNISGEYDNRSHISRTKKKQNIFWKKETKNFRKKTQIFRKKNIFLPLHSINPRPWGEPAPGFSQLNPLAWERDMICIVPSSTVRRVPFRGWPASGKFSNRPGDTRDSQRIPTK